MSFGGAVRSGLRNAFTFSGRASRSEFWWFYLFYVLCLVASFFLVAILLNTTIGVLPFFATAIGLFVPLVSVMVRRLHDKGLTGWLVLLTFVPFGGIALLILCMMEGDEMANDYGEPPRGNSSEPDTVTYTRTNIPNVRDDD